MDKQITAKILSVLIIVAILGSIILLTKNVGVDNDEDNERVLVSDRVTVDKSIIEGYEGEEYIPRSAGINKKLREEKDGNI